MVECTISTRVDGDVLKVFWSYCSEVGFIKVPRDNKSCIWVRGFLLTYIPVQFLECLVCVGLGGDINSRPDINILTVSQDLGLTSHPKDRSTFKTEI